MTTIHDVAALAGVSASSVSNVLNGRTDKLSAKTYSRVEAAIQTLNFSPNRVARQLKTGHTPMLGLLVPSIANPMYGQLALNIEAVAQSRFGYRLLLGNTHRDKAQESRMFDDMLSFGVRAVIVVSSLGDEQHLSDAAARGMAVVSYDRGAGSTYRDGRSPGAAEDDRWGDDFADGAAERADSGVPDCAGDAHVDHVSPDNFQAGYIAAGHLLAHGHRRLVFLVPAGRTISRGEKIGGFLKRAAQGGASIRADVLQGPVSGAARVSGSSGASGAFSAFSASGAFGDSELAEQVVAMRPMPTGVVTVNDMLAIGLMSGLQRLGLRVPDDISVVGMDGLSISAFVNPGLTSVAMPLSVMADAMVERAIARSMQSDLPSSNAVFKTTLVTRQSVAAPNAVDRNTPST
jgi:DNA-binding LacI/PurR family transcriptional regulator